MGPEAQLAIMDLSSRSKTLLVLLLGATGPVTANELAERMSLSPRKVRYGLDAVERWLAAKDTRLIRKPNYGFEVDAPQRVKTALLEQLLQSGTEATILCPTERVHMILVLLLTAEQPLLIKQLWRLLKVSRSTIVTDLKQAEDWLQQHRIALLRRANFGLQLVGSEAHIREALVDLLTEIIDLDKLLVLCSGSRLVLKLQGMPPMADPYLRSIESICARLPYVRTLVDLWEDTTDSQLTDDAYVRLALYLAVALERIAEGRHAEPEPARLRMFHQWRGRPTGVEIIRRMERHLECRLTRGDVDGIYVQLAAARVQGGAAQRAAEDSTALDRELNAIVDAMLDEASAYLHPCLKVDGELHRNLTCHLRPAWNRLHSGLPASNPLLKEIQDYDGYVYQVAKRCGNILASRLGQPVPVGEIGYIAMHLAAAMERVRPRKPTRSKVLVVCGEGSATAWLLVARLRAEFPDIEITAVKPARQVTDRDFADSDVIVSTYPLLTEKAPVRVVSPLLTAEDISSLRDLLAATRAAGSPEAEQLAEWSGPRLCDLIMAENVSLGVRASDWLEVIDRITHVLMHLGAVDSRFAHAVKETIIAHGPYMVSTPGVALLHARPGVGVSKLAMAMITLKPPVAFGHPENDPVDVAFALAAVDHRAHRRALLDLVRLVRDNSTLDAIRQAKTAGEVCTLLTAVSEATDITDFMPGT